MLQTGAFTDFSAGGKVKIVREGVDGTKHTLEINVQKILKDGDFTSDPKLQSEDVIIVPGKIFSVF
jgi:hypothetical protein